MTAYTIHADALFDPNKPILGSTHLEGRDNLIAVTEGDATAPKIALKAIERVAAGSTIRSRRDTVSVTSSAFEDGPIHTFDFIQIGTIRAIITRSATGSVQVVRLRNGVRTILSGPVTADISADVSVQPFDRILLEANTSGSAAVFNGRFSTDGGNLWAGSYARVEGNDV